MNSHSTSKIFILYLCLECMSPQNVSAETQEVFIRGTLNERRDLNRAGQSVVISPSGETRFDAQSHFKADPSLQLSGTSRVVGFSLPLFRGQDARSSHIFVDDMELQDPFSGLPMIDELDLRAFGGMVIHKGVSPWNVPVLDPGGVIQFSIRGFKSPFQGGFSLGDVSGASEWARSGGGLNESTSAGLYIRGSQASGKYKYYSDNNTILNSDDDRSLVRKNNDHRSTQGLFSGAWTGLTMQARSLAWLQHSDRGISLGEVDREGRSRLSSKTMVATASFRGDLSENTWFGVDAGGFGANRMFRDPDQSIGFATKRDLKSQSLRARLTGGYDSGPVSLIFSTERQVSKTVLSSTYENDVFSPESSANKIFWGSRLKIFEYQTVELKAGTTWLSNMTSSVSGGESKSYQARPANSGSIAWSRFADDLLVYSQIARYARPPSLLERVGDGAQFEGAPSLSAEVASALELGGRYFYDFDSAMRAIISVALWSRDNEEVIRIDRVSPLRWRARNGGEQKFRGAELRVDLGSDYLGVETAVSYMRSTQASRELIVPLMPLWQAAMSGRWLILPQLMLRTVSQYSGRVYHDLSNTRELNWVLTHDLSLDYSSSTAGWNIGFSVSNITDVSSRSVRDTISGKDVGRIAYSHYSGEPLPGRSLLLSASLGI